MRSWSAAKKLNRVSCFGEYLLFYQQQIPCLKAGWTQENSWVWSVLPILGIYEGVLK